MVTVEARWSWFYAYGFFRSKGSARLQCYDKSGNRDLIDDSVSTQNIETGFVSSTGMFTRRKMFRLGGACRLILLANSIALTEETVQSFKAFKLFKAIGDGRSYFRINWFV